MAGLADTLERAATGREVHGRLTFAARTLVAVSKVGGGNGAGDLENPDILVDRFAQAVVPGVPTAPAQIVQGGFGRVAQLLPEPIRDQSIQAGTLIDFVEIGQGGPGIQRFARLFVLDGRPLDIVEQAFDQVRCRGEIFEALLILNPDGRAAELIGQAHGGDVHFALTQHLRLGQIGGFVGPKVEGLALVDQPLIGRPGVLFGDRQHLRIQRRLAQTLFIDPRMMEQFVRDDRVVHPHAAFVKDSHNGFIFLQRFRD